MIEELLRHHSPAFQGMRDVYRVIHQESPVTKADLLKKMTMKQTTLVRHLDALKQYGLIRIASYDESSGGRPPALYDVEPKAAFIIGIALSRTETTVTIVDMSFQLAAEETFPMTEHHTPPLTISLLKQTITSLLARNQIDKKDVLGIGIGTVGPLDREKGVMYPEGFTAPGWEEVAVVEEMRESFHLDVFLENGANTAALYESLRRRQRNESILYCISGWGLRCGVLTNGIIMQSQKGDASSYGNMIIDAASGRTLSSFISYHHLVDKAERFIQTGDLAVSETNPNKNDVLQYVLQELKSGNAAVENIVLDSAYYYGVGLANMINVLHPEIVVLNSELIKVSSAYYEKVIQTAQGFISRTDQQRPVFQPADDDVNPTAVGACVFAFYSKFS
ncbi:ROK family transcriptional regulator [Salibacterium halotolerans]|uniref:Sugar kinase of the NBD/HSP70 family, may contain an N-terminal HTH domain n=1 Tax=Salibacterium halotolerans TaxID=1884432 RepID=A0A1I5W0Y7_9BACI|nr:ROK family transcriptional regulator [Salibacterium halotolerans]SFQ13375.1 Sugar kinase of the NBD/HSP70 family, may contain an N-terminal HTH domain [Salibacterium halotolerans]